MASYSPLMEARVVCAVSIMYDVAVDEAFTIRSPLYDAQHSEGEAIELLTSSSEVEPDVVRTTHILRANNLQLLTIYTPSHNMQSGFTVHSLQSGFCDIAGRSRSHMFSLALPAYPPMRSNNQRVVLSTPSAPLSSSTAPTNQQCFPSQVLNHRRTQSTKPGTKNISTVPSTPNYAWIHQEKGCGPLCTTQRARTFRNRPEGRTDSTTPRRRQ